MRGTIDLGKGRCRGLGAPLGLRRTCRAGLWSVGLLCISLLLPGAAGAAAGDTGHEGPSSAGAGASPTGLSPESKLWWNDGFWWASMWDADTSDFHIYRLDLPSQQWIDTGVALDDRTTAHADVLWDGESQKLYVASHKFSTSAASGYPSRLYRFSYNASTNTYVRDPGFPVSINNYRTETLVIDKDSTGQLWATWVQGGSVWVNATVCAPACDDRSWGTPFTISPSAVKSDDMSSLIALGGSRIGVMWSNQNTGAFYFAVHADGDRDDVWSVEIALQGSRMADDHINLKSDATGRVYAAVKTSKTADDAPLNLLLVRSATGSWSSHVFGLAKDGHTRPIVQIDEEHDVVHMFATSGGSIMTKSSPLASISFAPGIGTKVITDADATVNDATSTKRNVGSATGLVVAAHSSNRLNFHAFQSLGAVAPAPPAASFTTDLSSGTAPLTVQFTDTSRGTVESRAWDFDNDGVVDATGPSPTFTYAAEGTYTAKLTVANVAGESSTTATISALPPDAVSTLIFTPSDDAYVRAAKPDSAAGRSTALQVFRNDTAEAESYLRFTVSGVTGSVVSVNLRLFVTNGSGVSGSVYGVPDTSWSEGSVTWNTRPQVGSQLAGAQPAAAGTWVEFDVTGAVDGDGAYSFALKDGSSDTAWYSSKEGENDPELVLTFVP